MKVPIDGNEVYPDWSIAADQDVPTPWGFVEVDAPTLERWKRVMAEYAQVQREIDDLLQPNTPA